MSKTIIARWMFYAITAYLAWRFFGTTAFIAFTIGAFL